MRGPQSLPMDPQCPKDPRGGGVVDLLEQAPQALRLRAAISCVDRRVDIDIELANEEFGERPVREVKDVSLFPSAKDFVDLAEVDRP
ncbi:hypothetical protein GCM10009434_24140 [Brevundimonas olei]